MGKFIKENKETIVIVAFLLGVLLFIILSAKGLQMLDDYNYNNVAKNCDGEVIEKYTSQADKYWVCEV